MKKNILYLALKLPPVKLFVAVALCGVYGCVDPLPNIEYNPNQLLCGNRDTASVELIKGCLDLPCDINDCYLDNYYASIASLFPTTSICDVLSQTFWGSWGSEFHWDIELLNGKTCVNNSDQKLQLCLTDTNYNTIFSYPDFMEEVPAYEGPDISLYDCKHTMTLMYYSHYEDKCIIWTKVWMPGEGEPNSNGEVYEVCYDSNEPLIGQATGRGDRHYVYINNQFELVEL